MNTLIHADIFFFVTTICVVIATIVFVIAGIMAIRVLGDLRTLSEKARIEGEYIIDEVARARERIVERGFNFRTIFRLARRIFSRYY